ncbi:MAG: YceI family protein [Thermoflexibacter sp.]|jgi:polyisoprenoid-binding protein YceI|nr:YceI family protein [Thermoflexibacter sp.]
MKRFLSSIIGAVVLLTVFAFTTFKADTYKADVKESKIGWFAKKVTGQHNGYVNLKEGFISVEKGKITGGEFTMDMESINCEDIKDAGMNGKLVGHLKSDDFFSVAKNPTAKFVIKKVEYTGKKGNDDTYNLSGDLTIKGITNSVTFDAKTSGNGKKITAAAKLTFDRTLWKIEFRSGKIFENLGDKLIYDDVELTLNMTFVK